MKLEWSPDAIERYKNELRTGSGRVTIYLQFFENKRVEILYDLQWMGLGRKFIKMYGIKWELSKHYGLIKVQTIELAHQSNTYLIADLYRETYGHPAETKVQPEDSDEPATLFRGDSIYYEYILLPESAIYLPDDEGLAGMYPMGLANWNMEFDLLLWLHASTQVLLDNANLEEELRNGINALNLTKFQRWDYSMEPPLSQPSNDDFGEFGRDEIPF